MMKIKLYEMLYTCSQLKSKCNECFQVEAQALHISKVITWSTFWIRYYKIVKSWNEGGSDIRYQPLQHQDRSKYRSKANIGYRV